jgi:hypothetical protein
VLRVRLVIQFRDQQDRQVQQDLVVIKDPPRQKAQKESKAPREIKVSRVHKVVHRKDQRDLRVVLRLVILEVSVIKDHKVVLVIRFRDQMDRQVQQGLVVIKDL